MTPKLYKAADVCEAAQLQPYMLRSWEKEFPGIGVQKAPDSLRLYRQSDLDQVLRIRQLVFGEGLTLAGARRRLEGTAPVQTVAATQERAEVLDTLGADARETIAVVREGLRALANVLSHAPGTVTARGAGRREDEEYRLQSPVPGARASKPAPNRAVASRGTSARVASASGRTAKTAPAKRKRASA